MEAILYIMLAWIIIFTILPIFFGDKEVRLASAKAKLVLGGFLLYIGKEVKSSKKMSVIKPIRIAVILSMLVGMALFYIFFVPIFIGMIRDFIMFSAGVSNNPPQPVAVPVPILFTFTSILKYLVVSIAIGAAFHELAHAITALREGVDIRSWGIGIAFLIPLAFVELDDDSFKSASSLTKALIASAGPLANAIIALMGIALIALLPFTGISFSQAVTVTSIDCSICSNVVCPAEKIGLRGGDILYSINGSLIRSVDDVGNVLKRLKVGENVTFTICRNGICKNVSAVIDTYNKKLGNNTPCIGVSMENNLVVLKGGAPYNNPMLVDILNYINFVVMVNLSLYVFNAIPLFITDGSVFLSSIIPNTTMLRIVVDKRLLDIVNIIVIAIAAGISTYILLSG
ncbi:MAG: site-2 protease family protein [Ignisphaera sp.]